MVTCPVCGTPAASDDVFCNNCGQRLPQAQSPVVPNQESNGGTTLPPVPPMPGPPPITPSGSGASPSGGYAPPQSPVTPGYGATPQPSRGQVVTPEVQPTSYEAPPPTAGPPPVTPAQAAQPSKKKLSGCVIALIVAAALGLCAIAIVGGITLLPTLFPPDPTATPVPLVPPTSTTLNDPPPASGAEVPLTVVNASDTSICYLYISSATSEYWGDDWLEELGTILPGDSATFYVTAGETVDMQAEDCSGNILDTRYEVTIPANGFTYTISASPSTSSSNDTPSSGAEVPLDVVNQSEETICYLYVSLSSSEYWGDDWLEEIGTIPPGVTERFYLNAGDVVDMQIEDCDGNVLDEQYNVTVPADGLTYTYGP